MAICCCRLLRLSAAPCTPYTPFTLCTPRAQLGALLPPDLTSEAVSVLEVQFKALAAEEDEANERYFKALQEQQVPAPSSPIFATPNSPPASAASPLPPR